MAKTWLYAASLPKSRLCLLAAIGWLCERIDTIETTQKELRGADLKNSWLSA